MSVSKHRYERAKNAATTWHDLLAETQEKLEKMMAENQSLQNKLTDVPDYAKMNEELEEFKEENRELNKTIKTLKKQLREVDEKYKDKIAKLEREKLLDQGKIQQLEEAHKDLRERYSDLKQDYREQCRFQSQRMTEMKN